MNIGSGEVIKAIEKSDIPLTSEEIAKLIDISSSCVRRILCTLVTKDKSVDLKFRQLTPEEKKIRYHKVVNPPKIRVYWLE